MHEVGGQLLVVVESAPLVHPSPEDAFAHAQALTPSIDEGVQPKIKTAPRRASPTHFVVDSSKSTPTLYGLPFLQGPMEDLVLVILGQKARHLTPKRLFLTHGFRVSTLQLWARVPAFIAPRGKKHDVRGNP